jgi:hypothetical protein
VQAVRASAEAVKRIAPGSDFTSSSRVGKAARVTTEAPLRRQALLPPGPPRAPLRMPVPRAFPGDFRSLWQSCTKRPALWRGPPCFACNQGSTGRDRVQSIRASRIEVYLKHEGNNYEKGSPCLDRTDHVGWLRCC